jgi:hypothetical protein
LYQPVHHAQPSKTPLQLPFITGKRKGIFPSTSLHHWLALRAFPSTSLHHWLARKLKILQLPFITGPDPYSVPSTSLHHWLVCIEECLQLPFITGLVSVALAFNFPSSLA